MPSSMKQVDWRVCFSQDTIRILKAMSRRVCNPRIQSCLRELVERRLSSHCRNSVPRTVFRIDNRRSVNTWRHIVTNLVIQTCISNLMVWDHWPPDYVSCNLDTPLSKD